MYKTIFRKEVLLGKLLLLNIHFCNTEDLVPPDLKLEFSLSCVLKLKLKPLKYHFIILSTTNAVLTIFS